MPRESHLMYTAAELRRKMIYLFNTSYKGRYEGKHLLFD
jgi:hypothetical protein